MAGLSEAAELQPHLTEWRNTYIGETPLMLSPSSTRQVSEIVRVCADSETAIVPQGGNTGLCGGAIPDDSGTQILLSLGSSCQDSVWIVHSGYHPLKDRPGRIVFGWCTVDIILLRLVLSGGCLDGAQWISSS